MGAARGGTFRVAWISDDSFDCHVDGCVVSPHPGRQLKDPLGQFLLRRWLHPLAQEATIPSCREAPESRQIFLYVKETPR